MSINIFLIIVACSGAAFALLPYGDVIQKLAIVSIAMISILSLGRTTFPKRAISLIWPFLAYLIVALISGFATSGSILYTIIAANYLLIGLLLYIWAIYFHVNSKNIERIKAVLYIITFAQFLFSIIKFFTYGIDEKYLIGTMSHSAGQLGFLFPAVIVPIIVFLSKKKNYFSTYMLIGAMFIFGIINEKRAIVYLLPLIVIASLLINQEFSKSILRRAFVGLMLTVPASLIGIYAIPSLNIENQYGGEISAEHAFNYALDYLTMDYGDSLQGEYDKASSNTGIQVGRITLWASIYDWIRSTDGWTLLFGIGFGSVTPSMWLHDTGDLLFSTIKTRGAISGAGVSIIETGLIGFSLVTYFFIHIFIRIISAHKNSRTRRIKIWFSTLFIIHTIFCFDFFLYSTVLLRVLPMPLIFFSMLASIFHAENIEKSRSEKDIKLKNNNYEHSQHS